MSRDSGQVIATWGCAGRMAGQFKRVHNIDSKGTAEVGFGRRAQKSRRVE